MSPNDDHLATTGCADFIFEVDPDADVFDVVRRAIVDELEAEYADVLSVGVREHIRIDVVNIDPAEWVVEGALNGSTPGPIDFEVVIPANEEPNGEVIEHLRDAIDDRYAGHVDPEMVAFERIGMRPRAWFVDAKIPPSG